MKVSYYSKIIKLFSNSNLGLIYMIGRVFKLNALLTNQISLRSDLVLRDKDFSYI